MIQKALSKQLDSSVTVLTVAHRLSTIKDYDKVVRPPSGSMLPCLLTLCPWQLVLDAGSKVRELYRRRRPCTNVHYAYRLSSAR